jgi:hypothetical protein
MNENGFGRDKNNIQSKTILKKTLDVAGNFKVL